MAEPVISWLLEEENPSVRYLTLTTLLGRPESDPECRSSRQAIMARGAVARILDKQNDDGSWDVPERYYAAKYTGTVWSLLLLAELAAEPDDPRIRKACEFILRHAQNPESGGFSHTASSRAGTGLASGVIPCLTGNMVYSLIKLGYLEDSRLQRGIDWIAAWQRADDGEGILLDDPVYRRLRSCWGRHSCHMGAAKTMKALAAVPPGRRSPAAAQKLDELVEYFCKHHVYKKSHNLSEVSRPGWLKLGFPLMYQTDVLELLGIMAGLGCRDPRLDDAVAVIEAKRQADARWLLENSNNGKMQVRIEQKGNPSKWITLKALNALAFYRGAK